MASEYKLQIECSDLQVEVLVNDLPVFIQNGGQRTKNTLINQWTIDGRNRLVVRLRADEEVEPSKANSYLEISLVENEESLYNFVWTPKDSEKPLPQTTRKVFNSDSNFGEWAWQKAELLKLNETTNKEINRFIQKVQETLNSANINETMAIFRIKAEEQATAFGMDINNRIFQQRAFFEQWFSENGWRMERIDYEKLSYSLYGDNRVILVNYQNGDDVLQSAPVGEGEIVSFPLFISKISGTWMIVR